MLRRNLIEKFYDAWSRGDIDRALECCTDDVIAVNVPIGPVEGKNAVRSFLKKFGSGMSNAHYEIHDFLEREDLAMLEGQENYVRDGKRIALPFMAVFFFDGDLIREWRDYFDYATLKRQIS